MFNSKVVSEDKENGRSYSQTIQREYWILPLVSHKLEPSLPLERCSYIFHPFPCLTTQHVPPLGEPRPWLDTLFQERAEQY